MRKILVPTDFSAISDNALQFACNVAHQIKGEIFLLNIQSLPANDDAAMAIELIKTIEESDKEKLATMAEALKIKYPGLKIETHFAFGIPSLTIKEYLETKTFDFVVMGTRSASGMDKFLFGSVAESVSKHSPCPVIIVHADQTYKPVKHVAVPIGGQAKRAAEAVAGVGEDAAAAPRRDLDDVVAQVVGDEHVPRGIDGQAAGRGDPLG